MIEPLDPLDVTPEEVKELDDKITLQYEFNQIVGLDNTKVDVTDRQRQVMLSALLFMLSTQTPEQIAADMSERYGVSVDPEFVSEQLQDLISRLKAQ